MVRERRPYLMSDVVLDPRMDRVFKRIFGSPKNRDVLIGFLNDILVNNIKHPIVEVYLIGNEFPSEHMLEKSISIDVICKDSNDEQFIIEMQRRDSDDFIKRAQYYASRVYSAQLNESEQYSILKKVYFIAILDYELFPNHDDYRTDYCLYDEKHKQKDLNDFHFVFIELPKFNKKLAAELTSLEEKWCFFLSQMRNIEEIKKVVEGGPEYINHAWQTVQASNWTYNERMQYDMDVMTKMNIDNYERKLQREAEERVRELAITEGLELGKAEGLELGKAEGLELGKAEGLELGKAEGLELGKVEGLELGKVEGQREEKIEIAKNMLIGNIDFELISKLTGLSIKEIENIKN